jgi:hypothetical protein
MVRPRMSTHELHRISAGACPTCGRPHTDPPSDPDEATQLLAALRFTCVERGIWVSPDHRVRERDAADLMGYRPKTLRNLRALNDPKLPEFEIRAGRALYSLAAIAEWMMT